MVNDPGYEVGKGFRRGVNKKAAEIRREQLFKIIRELVQWENSNNPDVLKRANDAIWASWRETCELNKKHPQAATLFNPDILPAFHDPFAGGGALPLEAQRLGLAAYASDLNPVAVMINKAMLDIPLRFAGIHPIGPLPAGEKQSGMAQDWPGASGLAETVRRYGHWMRDEAAKRIGHLYPTITITAEMCATRPDLKPLLGRELTVIAWLWARTVRSANPAYSHCRVPLVSSFVLSSKKDKEAYVEPVISGDSYRFTVKMGKPPAAAKNGTKAARGANFTCLLSGSPLDSKHIKAEGVAGRMGTRLMAIVAEGKNGRIYLSPTAEMEAIAHSAQPDWQPDVLISGSTQYLGVKPYGTTKFSELFTARQLTALSTFSDLVQEAKERISADARAAGMTDDSIGLAQGGSGATAFAEAVAVYLAFAVDRLADFNSSTATWKPSGEQVMQTFKRQAIPMTWDFPESNILIDKSICWVNAVKYTVDNLNSCSKTLIKGKNTQSVNYTANYIQQADARTQTFSLNKVVSTDPPYYDNIPYADLSDFFYIWLRHNLRPIYPQLFATIAVPKDAELIASPHRHKNKHEAEAFFLHGMTEAMRQMATQAHPAFPVTIYYAFKQAESKEAGTVSTGWETFLQAVIRAGFAIVGTWPMRTEQISRMRGADSNALASSVVLVCQRRHDDAATVSRRDFQRELKQTLPDYLEAMIGGSDGAAPIAPVDLAQAAIGPGMAVYSQYAAVRKQDGSDLSDLSVHEALGLINQAISDYLSPEAGDFDAVTRFCNAWFEQYGWAQGAFGDADTLSRAKGTGVNAMHGAVIEALAGKVCLLRWQEYPAPADWQPPQGAIPAWQACHQLIRAFQQDGSDAAGALLARIPKQAEHIRQLCYHLYTLCERKKWAEDARAYNELANAWHDITIAAQGHKHQDDLFDG